MTVMLALALLATDYICKELPKIPGSTYQQIFELNNANQIAAGSDNGAYVYSAGGWTNLPAPAGLTQPQMAALGINDAGDVGGQAGDGLFIFSKGAFTLASLPGWPYAQIRALNSSGIGTGTAFDDNGNGTGFIYNPNGKAPYAAGFTEVAPPLPDGTAPFNVIVGQMNDAGQLVGGGFYPVRQGAFAFFFDPATGSTNLFKVNGWRTRARGLNNHGDVIAEALDPDAGVFRSYVTDSAGNVKREVVCPGLDGGSGGLFMVGINDQGVVSGGSGSVDTLGALAFPDASTALADLLDSSSGPGKSLQAKARVAAADYAAGDIEGTCSMLASYASEVTAQTGKHVDALLAPSLLGEASAIGAALHCP